MTSSTFSPRSLATCSRLRSSSSIRSRLIMLALCTRPITWTWFWMERTLSTAASCSPASRVASAFAA
ncbi:hypothetical protein BBK82_18215 [Lentzea guizhouensis]|uniref:Uncharacterized protein n=1 Tax=Lentzea guizhouensis TaxID=1586287 RepID=A0A1B2HJ07_9PSEU|nr:hypothetical protein BBK82_18215 [Lentzea guizhouensis]